MHVAPKVPKTTEEPLIGKDGAHNVHDSIPQSTTLSSITDTSVTKFFKKNLS